MNGRLGADAAGARLQYAYYEDGGLAIHHFDAADREDQGKLEKALGGAKVAIASKSSNGERMIVRALKENQGAEYYFYDKSGRRLEMIAAE